MLLECGCTWIVMTSSVLTALGIEKVMFDPAWFVPPVVNAPGVATAILVSPDTPSAVADAGVAARKTPLANASKVANPAAATLRKWK